MHLDKKALYNDRALLAHPPGTSNGLLLKSRIQCRLQQEHMIGCCQIDAHCPRAGCQQEDCCWRISAKVSNCCKRQELSASAVTQAWKCGSQCIQALNATRMSRKPCNLEQQDYGATSVVGCDSRVVKSQRGPNRRAYLGPSS